MVESPEPDLAQPAFETSRDGMMICLLQREGSGKTHVINKSPELGLPGPEGVGVKSLRPGSLKMGHQGLLWRKPEFPVERFKDIAV